MAKVWTSTQICENALRKIGTFAINDSGVRKAEMDVAVDWLDMLIAHTGGTARRWWLVPDTAPLILLPTVDAYQLRASLPGAPEIQDVIEVVRVDLTSGMRDRVEVQRRQEWELRERAATGSVNLAYYDRLDPPTLRVHPAPAAPLTYRLDVVFQRFPSDLTNADGLASNDFRRAWSLWAVTALAAELGDGPVRKLPSDEVRDMRREADRQVHALDAWDGQERADEPRRTIYNDF
ncbi:MAG: hypothetical protein RIR25_1830 [Verrucomicrobiota bacterium]|jgi:hypothetical protein